MPHFYKHAQCSLCMLICRSGLGFHRASRFYRHAQACRKAPAAARGMATAAAADNLAEARQLAVGAFTEDSVALQPTTNKGPLTGLTFAVKDLYDVKGRVTGFGNPTWRDTHGPATSTAPAVQACLDAGASCVGITHMDELAYSLNGENVHYGTPRNPACPDRIPGGSSSGSAVAVASGAVDFALGSDTGGSVRVPASYCGILGLRPSQGRVSLASCAALAPSYDTGGFFADSPAVLRRVGDVLLDPCSRRDVILKRWLVAKDAFALVEDYAVTQALYEAVKEQKSAWDAALSLPEDIEVGVSSQELPPLDAWWDIFRISQGAEVWETLGEWVVREKPTFGPGTKERFEMASQLLPEEVKRANAQRAAITAHLDSLLGEDGVLMLPSAAGPPPLLNTPPAELDAFRKRLISLTCIAGLAGLPQVSLPGAKVGDCPIGLGLIGPRGSDEALLALTEKVAPLLQNY